MAAIGIASMALGAASSIFGGIKAAKAQKDANKIRKEDKQRESAWYQRRYNQNYADTAAGQQVITAAKDYARDNFERAQGASAVGGGTTAATAAAKESSNKVVGNALGNIAANDTARKDNVDAQHNAAQTRQAATAAATEEQRANNINAAATQAGNALIQGGGALLQDTAKPSKVAAAPPSPTTPTQSSERTEGTPTVNVKPNTGSVLGTKYQWNDFWGDMQ